MLPRIRIKIQPSTVDKSGSKFTIFELSNLRDIPATVKVMAFKQVYLLNHGLTKLKFKSKI